MPTGFTAGFQILILGFIVPTCIGRWAAEPRRLVDEMVYQMVFWLVGVEWHHERHVHVVETKRFLQQTNI